MKCMLKTGDCVIKHAGTFTTGLGMVVSMIFKLKIHRICLEIIYQKLLFIR